MDVENLKKEVNEIKTKVNPEPTHHIIHFSFGTDNTPHSYLHGNILHLVTDKHGKETKWFEAEDTEKELKEFKAYYDDVISQQQNKFMKAPTHQFHSFESFLEYHRCKCGKHGADNKQPFLGVSATK